MNPSRTDKMARASPGSLQRWHLVQAILVVFLAGGCGSKVGSVSGKVTYEGEAVPGGFVDFVPQTGPQKGTVFSGTIDTSGKYQVTGVPVGPATILIRHPGGPPTKPRPGENPAPRKQYPTRYATAEGSELQFTVAGGSQEYNIDLKAAREP
jgi:hypothetical protein